MKIHTLAAGIGMAVLGATASTWAQPATPYYGQHMMWNGGWFGWFLGPIMMIVFLAIAVAVVMLVVRWMGGTQASMPTRHLPDRTPLEILKERFAKGEIDKEEFEERRRVLGE